MNPDHLPWESGAIWCPFRGMQMFLALSTGEELQKELREPARSIGGDVSFVVWMADFPYRKCLHEL